MARPCTICRHPELAAINAALVAGEPAPRITAKHREISDDALLRHAAAHLPATLARARAAEEATLADDLLSQAQHLQARALQILERAEAAGDLRTALAAIGQARGCLELLAEMVGELDRRPQFSLSLSPEWLTVRTQLFLALAPYPEARTAVAGKLEALEIGTNGHTGR